MLVKRVVPIFSDLLSKHYFPSRYSDLVSWIAFMTKGGF